MLMRRFTIIVILMLGLLQSCCAGVRKYGVEVVKEYPHDSGAYTQGLFFHGGQLYESTGQYGSSSFRKIDLATGKALEKVDFNRKYFVEGSVMLGDELFILTWESRVAFIYDAATLKYKSSYSYPREGWGLTTDGEQLIASDGSSRLYFMDNRFKVLRTVDVTLDGRPLRYLNELEYVDGKIWANVYTTDMIVIIDPSDGRVTATVDCTGLLPKALRDRNTDVLNGIAYDAGNRKLYLTGKNWKRMYEVRLKEKK